MHTALLIARLTLAVVFAVAALTKLADRAGTRRAVVEFGTPHPLVGVVAAVLPLLELATAIALLASSSARWGAAAALVLLLLFSAAIVRSIARGEAPDCHCFGQLHSEPAGWRALARNAVLGALAGYVLVGGWNGAGASATAWVTRLDGVGVVALAGGCALVILTVASAAFMLALLRQNGRLLLRIDALETRLDQAGVAAPTPSGADQPDYGLAVGTPAPEFSLDGLYGETVTLRSLIAREQPVLLLFTDPACGPCNALLPKVAGWQNEHEGELTITVISRGSVDDNRPKAREHGVSSVWLDSDLTVYNAYEVPGTPSAVLVDKDGRIASPARGGADAITQLLAQATGRPLAVEHVPAQRQPTPPTPPPRLPVGTQAPMVELPDLTGRRTSLTAEARYTLVLFWNPGCGFCQRMLDDLRDWEADPPQDAPRLVLISTGSTEQNQAMGLSAPILLDTDFATATKFGTTGTPSGVLIDPQGRIASELAIGAPGVMALAAGPNSRSRL